MERLGVQMNLATLNRQRGKIEEAETLFLDVISTSDRLARMHPTEQPLRVTSSAANNNVSILYQRSGKLNLAETYLSRSRELKESLLREQPENKRYRYLVAASYVNSGDLEGAQSRPELAVSWYSRAVTLFDGLVRDHPKDRLSQSGLGKALQGLGACLGKGHQPVEAVPVLARSIVVFDALADQAKGVREFAADAVMARALLSAVKSEMRESGAAMDLADEAMRRLAAMEAKAPGDTRLGEMLTAAHRGRAVALDGLGRSAGAESEWKLALAHASVSERDELRGARPSRWLERATFLPPWDLPMTSPRRRLSPRPCITSWPASTPSRRLRGMTRPRSSGTPKPTARPVWPNRR